MFLNHLQLGVSSASLFKICELLVYIYMKVRTVIFLNRPHTPKRPVNQVRLKILFGNCAICRETGHNNLKVSGAVCLNQGLFITTIFL